MEKWKGPLYLVAAFTLAGTSVIAARFVSGRLGVFTITAASLFFAVLGLLVMCSRRLVEAISSMELREWATLLLQAACGIFLFRMFLLQGLMCTSTGEAGILTGATPAVTAVLAVFFLKEPVQVRGFLGIASTVIGIGLLQRLLLPGNGLHEQHLAGNILVLCAAVCESSFNILSRIHSLRSYPSPDKTLAPIIQTTIVVGLAFLLALVPASFEQPISALQSLDVKGWLALVWYGLVVTALAFIFWYAGIRRCRASTAAAISGMMPFTSLVLSVLLLREQAGWVQWFGGAAIILGMILIGGRETGYRQTEKQPHSQRFQLNGTGSVSRLR